MSNEGGQRHERRPASRSSCSFLFLTASSGLFAPPSSEPVTDSMALAQDLINTLAAGPEEATGRPQFKHGIYRPASAHNILARVRCRSLEQKASTARVFEGASFAPQVAPTGSNTSS